MNILVCYTTLPDEQSARQLAQKLIESHVAACVQISAPMRTLYQWNGAICDEMEFSLVIKTACDQQSAVLEVLQAHHPYDLPQIIWQTFDAQDNYAQWVVHCTRAEQLKSSVYPL